MKLSIALSALLVAGFVAAGTVQAGAVVYCQYVDYPVGCKSGCRVTPAAGCACRGDPRRRRPGTPMNRGGPVDHAGRLASRLKCGRSTESTFSRPVRYGCHAKVAKGIGLAAAPHLAGFADLGNAVVQSERIASYIK
jgi:hypothetical protein